MELTFSKLASISNFSNDKMVNYIKTKLAESENAAVALVFDDKLIVLDEDTDQFYTVNYEVSKKNLKLSEWEPINLVPDNETRIEELANEYFDPTKDSGITVGEIVEAFKLKYSDEPIKRLINQSAIDKRRIIESNEKIKALTEVRKIRTNFVEDIQDIVEDDKISVLMSRLQESDSAQGTITRVDFRSPVNISLFEESNGKVVNLTEKKKSKQRTGNIRKKVNNLWTSESFKEDLKDLIDFIDEGENAKAVVTTFFSNHSELLILDESEVEDLILKTSLMIGEVEKSDSLSKMFKDFFTLGEAQEMREEFMLRNNISEKEEDKANDFEPAENVGDEEGEEEEPKEKAKDDKETSIDEDSINKIVKVLNKMKDSLDEKSLEFKYVKSFIEALEDAKVGSMSEGKLKEILDFLTSIYEKAKSDKDEEDEE